MHEAARERDEHAGPATKDHRWNRLCLVLLLVNILLTLLGMFAFRWAPSHAIGGGGLFPERLALLIPGLLIS